jgi:predicted PhzF superfamily epimerase YddE/YHI9
VEHRFFDSARIALRVEQGVQMAWPSLLYLRAQPDDVRVGGQVFEVAKGEIF